MSKSKKLPSINLEQGLYFRVAGEEEKQHKISWELLKKIGDNTQMLISKLAEYSLSDDLIYKDALKLEFIGFYPGSAIPAFSLMKQPNLLFIKKEAFQKLNSEFSFVLGHLDDGNFQAIADNYNEPAVKNDMIDTVAEFSNSAGTKPFSIVIPSKANNFRPVAKIRYISPEIKAQLKVNVPIKIYIDKNAESSEAVSKILIKKSAKGKITKKISHLYTQKEAILSLKFDNIETERRIYSLSYEAIFTITEDSKKGISIENPMLDIYASGCNMNEAEQDLFDQFDYTYQRLNQFDDTKLSKHLLVAKNYINTIVDKVMDK